MNALQQLEKRILELDETATALRSRIQYLLYLHDDAELIDGERVAAASSALRDVTELLRSLLAEAEALRESDGD